MPSNPAALENSNTSPFGILCSLMASMVSARDTVSTAVATAFRKLLFLFVMLTMIYLFSFH
jgi:hypothetical protein